MGGALSVKSDLQAKDIVLAAAEEIAQLPNAQIQHSAFEPFGPVPATIQDFRRCMREITFEVSHAKTDSNQVTCASGRWGYFDTGYSKSAFCRPACGGTVSMNAVYSLEKSQQPQNASRSYDDGTRDATD